MTKFKIMRSSIAIILAISAVIIAAVSPNKMGFISVLMAVFGLIGVLLLTFDYQFASLYLCMLQINEELFSKNRKINSTINSEPSELLLGVYDFIGYLVLFMEMMFLFIPIS